MTTPASGVRRFTPPPVDSDSLPAPVPARAVPLDGSAPPPPAPAGDDFFADPDATKMLGEDYGLPPGQWLEVKMGLDWGQEQALQLSMFGGRLPMNAMNARGELDTSKVTIDTAVINIATLKTWVRDWSLTHKGQRVPVDEPHIRGLKPWMADRILKAVQRHIAEVQEGNGIASSEPTGGSTSE